MARAAGLAWLLAGTADGHGAVVWPPSRNAVDKDLAPWNGPVPAEPPSVESMTGWCPVTAYAKGLPGAAGQPGCGTRGGGQGAEMPEMPVDAKDTCDCADHCRLKEGCAGWTFALGGPGHRGSCSLLQEWKGFAPDDCEHCWSAKAGPPPAPSDPDLSGQNGQACFWFSNGCALGCETCDGTSRGPIPWNDDPYWKRKFNLCNNQTVKATVCDPKKRSVNRDAECGAVDDWYYYSPWRAPGSAPVFDPCGVAGGHKPPQGKFGGIYVNTTHAKLGDLGSEVLPVQPTGVTWAAGSVIEVSWTIEANHGGGYQYRLAPKGPLTEELFQKMPLEFVGQQTLRWGGVHGKTLHINGTYVSEGTSPPGSTWVMNPIPRNDHVTGTGFPAPCEGTDIPLSKCQGMIDGTTAVADLEIIDRVRIPVDLPPGEYVLGWRWDCEESNQIWQSCSDVTIKQVKECTWLKDTDYYTGGPPVGENMTKEDCCADCQLTPGCAFTVWNPESKQCWHKPKTATPFHNPGDVACCPIGSKCPTKEEFLV